MSYLFMLLAVVFPGDLSGGETLELDDGVEYVGTRLPSEVSPGGAATIELYFKAEKPLPDNVSNFLHVESSESDCRVINDRKPSGFEEGKLRHDVEIRIPNSDACKPPQHLEVYTGFYEVDTGRRYRVESSAAPDNRIPAASIDLVAGGGDAEIQTFTPSDIQRQQVLNLLHPWRWWLAGLAVMLALALGMRRLLGGESREDNSEGSPFESGLTDLVELRRWWVVAGIALLAVPAILSILAALNFVKDDAYISFRYAHNLVAGEGLVFNPGERVEGFTNFLWVLVIAPFEAMRLDLFQVTEIIGSALVLGVLVQATWASFHVMGGPRRDMSHLWAGLWIATSSSLGMWATSGMEQPLAMLLPLAGAYLLWTSWDDEAQTRRAAASGVLIGLGCMTRPEIHLIGILLGLPLVWRILRDRRLGPIAKYWFAGLLGITVPFHLFRLWYFGSLLPNTYFVKTGGGSAVLLAGLDQLHDLFAFNNIGFLLLLAPLAFLDDEHRREKWIMLGIAVGFMAYLVKVGDDEMSWHRLYLPALPYLVLLAALGLRNLCASVAGLLQWRDWKRLAVYAVGWGLVLAAAGTNLSFTIEKKNGFNGRGSLSGNYHPDIGKFLTRHAGPGELVAFQDMGSTPYHAPDLKFLDFIGLVDETVAHARHDHGLHAFVPTGSQGEKAAYDAEMREYFYERSPEWVILTSYIPGGQAGRVSREFSKRPVPSTLEPWIGSNTYQFQIYNEKFKKRYSHVRTWPRSSTYYLSLFRRTDLWQKTPGEVVIGENGEREAGEPLGGVKAKFEEGLTLRGSRLQARATERQEFLVTTRWEVPGAMREDLFFFLHVEKKGYRSPYDHLPGDWMYPANRWEEGQIIEDRTLFQIPPNMRPGRYDVYMGAYFRRDGRRLELVEGPSDGRNRLKLGTVEVVPFRPLLDHIIRPTHVDFQRKFPDRLVGGEAH